MKDERESHSPDPAAVLNWMRNHRDALVDFVSELARMESPSDDPEAQRPVQRRLTEAFEELGYRVGRAPGRMSGGHLLAVPTGRDRSRPNQLMVGHCDTVWSHGTLPDMPVVEEDGRLKGPGVFDMKAGLTQMIFALRCLRDLGLEPALTPIAFINSDEEIGSPESKRWVRRVAQASARAWVLEPAVGEEGKVKTARKGVANYTLTVRGKAAHAGLDPTGGASAIEGLARVIPEVHALTDLDRGSSVNVGVIRGGTRPNVIAAEAVANVDVRVVRAEEAEAVDRALRRLRSPVPGTTLEVEGGLHIPPLERTPAGMELWARVKAAGERLGLDLEDALVGGASDGNTTSLYCPTVDGLGAVGDGAHADHEHLVVDRWLERCALLVELLLLPEAPRPPEVHVPPETRG